MARGDKVAAYACYATHTHRTYLIFLGVFHTRYKRAHIDLQRGDLAFLLVADGFRVFDTGEKSAWTANLMLLNFPPEMRSLPQFMFNLFGFSGSPAGSLEPFMQLTVAPFITSFHNEDQGVHTIVLLHPHSHPSHREGAHNSCAPWWRRGWRKEDQRCDATWLADCM